MNPLSRRIKRVEDWMAECQRQQQRTFDAKVDGLTYDAKNQEFISPGMLPLALHEMQTVIDQLKSDVQHYKDVNFKQFEQMRGYVDKIDQLKESKDALASIHSSLINNNEELKAELEEFRKRSVGSWKADREKDIELSSLKYQNKQGVSIRAAMQARIDALIENASILQTKNKSQSEYIKTLIAKVDSKDDMIKAMRNATVNNKVHVLVYKYSTQLQSQVAGVFSSHDLMDDWIRENPAARDEETEVYSYTINEGEL